MSLDGSSSPPAVLNRNSFLFVLPDGAGVIAHRGQGQFPNYENVLPKTPLEARWYSIGEELLDGLTKLSPTARKAPSPAVKLGLSKSPVAIKTENDGTTNRVTLGHTRFRRLHEVVGAGTNLVSRTLGGKCHDHVANGEPLSRTAAIGADVLKRHSYEQLGNANS